MGDRLPAPAGRDRPGAAGAVRRRRPTAGRPDPRPRRRRGRAVVHHQRPAPARPPARVRQPRLRADDRLRLRRGRGAQLPLPAGPRHRPGRRAGVRDALQAEEHRVVTLLNYRKDGTAFWNELSLSPVFDGERRAHPLRRHPVRRHRPGARRARARAHLAAERAARAAGRAGAAPAGAAGRGDVDARRDARRRRVARPAHRPGRPARGRLVHRPPASADDGACSGSPSRHRDPGSSTLLRRLEELQPSGLHRGLPPRSRCSRGGRRRCWRTSRRTPCSPSIDGRRAAPRSTARSAPRSAIVVPLRARRQVLGVLALFSDGSGRTYDDDDLAMAADLARRAGADRRQRAALRARARRRRAAAAQPAAAAARPRGLDRAARYLPGSRAAQVGGDWYDLFRLPDGAVGIAIGDVMGHDMTAAAAMGQLRSVLQTLRLAGQRPGRRARPARPARAGPRHGPARDLRLRPARPARRGRRAAAARQRRPPPARPAPPDGTVVLLDGAPSLLVGAALGTDRATSSSVPIEPGSMLVLYTDGLVEHRGLDPDAGLERLRLAVEAVDGPRRPRHRPPAPRRSTATSTTTWRCWCSASCDRALMIDLRARPGCARSSRTSRATGWSSSTRPTRSSVVRADLTWLLSSWTCVYGRGCQGVVEGRADDGCCSHGAFWSDDEDEQRVTAAAAGQLKARLAARRRSAASSGSPSSTSSRASRPRRTRTVDGACVFLNRPGLLRRRGLRAARAGRAHRPAPARDQARRLLAAAGAAHAGVGHPARRGRRCW